MDEDRDGVTAVLDRGLEEARRRTGLTVAFGGLVHPDGRQFVISALRGTSTGSLRNLAVRSGEGLGGKALALARPATVVDYRAARGITRRYDHAVAPERLQSVVSLPVALPGRAPLAMLYLAERHEVGFEGRLYDRLGPTLLTLAHDLSVEVEVARRVRVEVARVLAGLVPTAPDGAAVPGGRRTTPSPLTPREADVLRGAETGCSNAEIADDLGLVESTVKSYMKSAMAKLGADNRVRAARAARQAGHLDR